jgi:GNAT superfamily N-acetyltransferase
MAVEDSTLAVRAACFTGEPALPSSERTDGHDHGATHVIAHAGGKPVGAVRIRWFVSFAMTEGLAVIRGFRGHGVGGLLLERCERLARSRGCNVLYAQVLPHDIGYWVKHGWRRLVPQAQSRADAKALVSMVKAADPARPLPEVEEPETHGPCGEPHIDATGRPVRSFRN